VWLLVEVGEKGRYSVDGREQGEGEVKWWREVEREGTVGKSVSTGAIIRGGMSSERRGSRGWKRRV